MKTCARCKGKFPEPGIVEDGKVYCCEKCAKGPKHMLAKAIPGILLIFGFGFFIGYSIQRR